MNSRVMQITCATMMLLGLSIYLLLQVPIAWLLDDEQGVQYTDLSGATLSSGDLWVRIPAVSGMSRVQYRFCPGFSGLSWCVSLSHPDLNAEGRVSYVGQQSIRLNEVAINRIKGSLVPGVGGFLTGHIRGKIRQARLRLSDCPITDLQNADANLRFDGLNFLSQELGPHRFVLTSQGQKIDIQISGEVISGAIMLNDGQYEAKGEFSAPTPELQSMAQSFMRSISENRFGWELQGVVPC